MNTETALIPHEVVSAVVDGATPARAWREHLHLTQSEVAKRLQISQSSYAEQESSDPLNPQQLAKLAAAMNILPEQLDF